MNTQDKKEIAQNFQKVLDMAELKALSSYSLEHPLNDQQFSRMMELKNNVFGGGKD